MGMRWKLWNLGAKYAADYDRKREGKPSNKEEEEEDKEKEG